MNEEEILHSLSELAVMLGSDNGLVQGAGGNISYKNDSELWVKASGMWLSDAKKRNIFSKLNLTALLEKIEQGSDDYSGCVIGDKSLHPSIETSLHAIMPHRIVVHVHSLNALAWLVRRDGKDQLPSLLSGLEWAWVNYVRPGFPLTTSVRAVLQQFPHASILMLQNHGIVIGADTIDSAVELLRNVEIRLGISKQTVPPVDASLIDKLSASISSEVRLPENHTIHLLGQQSDYEDKVITGALYPDHVIFLGNSLPVISMIDQEQIKNVLSTPPYCAIISGIGVVLGTQCLRSAEVMLECFVNLVPQLPEKEKLNYLTPSDIGALLNWDAEKIRQELDKKRIQLYQ